MNIVKVHYVSLTTLTRSGIAMPTSTGLLPMKTWIDWLVWTFTNFILKFLNFTTMFSLLQSPMCCHARRLFWVFMLLGFCRHYTVWLWRTVEGLCQLRRMIWKCVSPVFLVLRLKRDLMGVDCGTVYSSIQWSHWCLSEKHSAWTGERIVWRCVHLAGTVCTVDDSALNYDWLKNIANSVSQKQWLWT